MPWLATEKFVLVSISGVGFGADFSQFGSSQQPQFNSNQQAPNVFQSSGGNYSKYHYSTIK